MRENEREKEGGRGRQRVKERQLGVTEKVNCIKHM